MSTSKKRKVNKKEAKMAEPQEYKMVVIKTYVDDYRQKGDHHIDYFISESETCLYNKLIDYLYSNVYGEVNAKSGGHNSPEEILTDANRHLFRAGFIDTLNNANPKQEYTKLEKFTYDGDVDREYKRWFAQCFARLGGRGGGGTWIPIITSFYFTRITESKFEDSI